jgi:betaine-aldehyde dehydrogenase
MTELTIIPASGAALPAEPFTARHLIDGAWVDSAMARRPSGNRRPMA